MNQDSYTVLLVSDDNKTISLLKAFLVQPVFDLKVIDDFYEASRLSETRSFDFIIADLTDSGAIDFSVNVSDGEATVLLLVPQENFEEVSYRVENYGVLTVSKPLEAQSFYATIKIAIAVHHKIKLLSNETVKLKNKMEEIRIINKAKLLLVEKRKMTEDEAHHYLEKQAMDSGKKRIAVAQDTIGELEE